MAALTVQEGLVKSKMKGGVYSRPLPLMGLFLLEHPVYCSDKFVRTTVPTNLSEQYTFPQICRNSILGVPIENKHVKGGGRL